MSNHPNSTNSLEDSSAKEVNRSSAMTPEMLALVTAATSAAVKEALAGLTPIIQQLALTPEKIAAAEEIRRAPTKKELEAMRRAEREALLSKEDAAEAARRDAQRKANCPHLDKNGRSALGLIHNYPDHQPRGICPLCQDLINPREWRIGAPDEQHPRGVPVIVPAHKDYKMVMALEAFNSSQV